MKISEEELEKLVGDLTEAVTKVFEIRMEILNKTEIHSEEMFSLLDQVTNGDVSDTKEILKNIRDMEISENVMDFIDGINCQIEDEGMDR